MDKGSKPRQAHVVIGGVLANRVVGSGAGITDACCDKTGHLSRYPFLRIHDLLDQLDKAQFSMSIWYMYSHLLCHHYLSPLHNRVSIATKMMFSWDNRLSDFIGGSQGLKG